MKAGPDDAKLPVGTRRALAYARGYLDLGLTAEAAEELARVEPAERHGIAVCRLRGEVALARGAWQEASAEWELLRERAPEDPEHWINAAFALRRHAGIAVAREVLLAGRARHPGEATIHFNLACYAAQTGELAAARDHLADACRLAPGFRALAREDPDLAPLRAAEAEG